MVHSVGHMPQTRGVALTALMISGMCCCNVTLMKYPPHLAGRKYHQWYKAFVVLMLA